MFIDNIKKIVLNEILETFKHVFIIFIKLNMIMKSLLLYFLMFYLLQVSFAKMAVCKRITSNKESENVSKDYHKSFIFIEKTNSIKGPKGENGTNGEKGENGAKGQKGENGTKGEKGKNGTKGERGDIVQINQTEINQLKHKISG